MNEEVGGIKKWKKNAENFEKKKREFAEECVREVTLSLKYGRGMSISEKKNNFCPFLPK